MEISHMTLLIVALAFTLVNICLIIAYSGIIYNWQDRFVGPILSCKQPKWTSDGRTQRMSYGYYNPYVDNYNRNTNNNNWNSWNNNGNANVNANANWDSNGNANANVNWNNGNNNAYVDAWGAAATMGNNMDNGQWIIGGQTFSSIRGNAWSTCPILSFPRWYQDNTVRAQSWNTWNTNTNNNWNSWANTGSNWAAWGNANAVAWSGDNTNWNTWTNNVNANLNAWTNDMANNWSNWNNNNNANWNNGNANVNVNGK